MLPAPHHYQDESDLRRMCSLLQAGRAARISSYYVHSGDLKWWLYYPPLGASLWDHIYLWEDPAGDNRLMGWVLLNPSDATFDVYCQPELYHSPLAEAMFAWAEEALISAVHPVGRKRISMFWVTPEDSFRTRWLEARGYRVTGQDPALTRPLAEPIPEWSIPEGFQARSSRGLAEVEARARAQYGAFGSSAPFDQYLQRFTRFMQSAAYQPEADVVVAASGDDIAAFCITWIDEVNQVGLFEPVGTHPGFQRKGLGKVVMLEALRRLQGQGMQQAIVCTAENNAAALQLYASVGFRQYSVFRFYTKDLD